MGGRAGLGDSCGGKMHDGMWNKKALRKIEIVSECIRKALNG